MSLHALCPTCGAESGEFCRGPRGTRCTSHARRLLAAFVLWAVPAMMDWLAIEDRDELTATLLESIPEPADTDAGPLVDPAGNDLAGSIDIDRAGPPVLAAQQAAEWIRYRLEDHRHGVDLSALIAQAATLTTQAGEVHALLCRAGRAAELEVRHGATPDQIGLALARHRARVVDTELAPTMPTADADGAVTWTVEYHEHGGFVATVIAGAHATGPRLGWGYAPTPRSAAATVASFSPHRRPVVVLSPQPRHPPRWAEFSPDESDMAEHGQRVGELLVERGPVYVEHLQACARVAHLLRGQAELGAYLAERAARLNARDPQPPHAATMFAHQKPANPDHDGTFHTTAWVPTKLVVATGHQTWGDFGDHRPLMPLQIAKALADADDLEAFTSKLFTNQIHLTIVPAWAGPIYRVGSNGNHRVHTARMLDLPWLAARIIHTKPPPAWHLSSVSTVESHWSGRHWDENWGRRRHALLDGLIRRGIIDAEFDDNPRLSRRTVRCARLPAPWLVRAPELAAAANALYERRYPGALAALGIPTEIGTDAAAWETWLTSTPSRP